MTATTATLAPIEPEAATILRETMMMGTQQLADVGFHAGELAVQRKAGVEHIAARLSQMLEPVTLTGGIAGFLSDRTFLVFSGRDAAGRLWASPLVGPPGFLEVQSDTTLAVHAVIPAGDPLQGLPAGQKIGMTTVEFATRRRVRINGTLTVSGDDLLVVEVEQSYGNCPQYIQQRVLAPNDLERAGRDHVREGSTLEPEDLGNNLFNSLGNLSVNPEAALLFFDFTTGQTLHLSGTTKIEWGEPGRPGDDGHTGRIARFTLQRLVAGHLLPARETAHTPYPRNPALTD